MQQERLGGKINLMEADSTEPEKIYLPKDQTTEEEMNSALEAVAKAKALARSVRKDDDVSPQMNM